MIPFEEASPSIAPEVALMSILVRGVPSNTTCKGEPMLNTGHKQIFSIHFEEETLLFARTLLHQSGEKISDQQTFQ